MNSDPLKYRNGEKRPEDELRPFIPPVLLYRRDFTDRCEHQVVILFVDVAGFTNLSETLESTGPEGAERLDRAIAQYFDALMDVVDGFGGYPIKISGDAITVLFYRGKSLKAVIRRAIACALALRGAGIRAGAISIPDGRTIHLAHKIGVGSGRLFSGLVGEPSLRQEYIFAGEALDRAATAEHHAAAGEVWLAPDVARVAGGSNIIPCNCCEYSKLASTEEIEKAEKGKPASSPRSSRILTRHRAIIPQVIQEHAARGALRFLARHQSLTTLFIGFSGFIFESLQALDRVDLHYRQLQRIIYEHGGYLSEFEAGDKGTKLIAFFGAPVALENPAKNAGLCARALQNAASKEGLVKTQGIGIATRRMYVGRIGCRSLAKYSAFGSGMNLAARLMALASSWMVLAEQVTVERSAKLVSWSRASLVEVKGIQEAIKVSSLQLSDKSHRLERRGRGIIGRDQELRFIKGKLSGLTPESAQCGSLMLLEGPPGIGKTRVLDSIRAIAADTGMPVINGDLTTFDRQSRPMSGFRPLLYALLDMDKGLSPEELSRRFQTWLEQLPEELRQSGARIAPILNIPWPEDANFKCLEPERKIKLRQQSLVDCLLFCSQGTPRLFVIDNAQQLDAFSINVFNMLAPIIEELPLLVLLARRSLEKKEDEPFAALLKLPGISHISLTPLLPIAARDLILDRIGVRFIDSELAAFLQERAQGNPLRLESWIDVLRERGHLRIQEEVAYLIRSEEVRELPARLEALVLTRLELLPAPVQLTIRVSSVLGATFSEAEVSAIHPNRISLHAAASHLQQCHQAGLLRYKRRGALGYFFSHPELRRALHESLPFKLRRELHLRCSQLILERSQGELDENRLLDLARHHEYINVPEMQHRFFCAAAKIGKSNYDQRNVVHWARRDLAVCKELAEMEGLHEAFSLLQWGLGMLGEVGERCKQVEEWVRWAESIGDTSKLLEALECYTKAKQFSGDWNEASLALNRAIEVARARGSKEQLVSILVLATAIHGDCGRITESVVTAEEAVQASSSDEAPSALAMVLSQRGFAYSSAGRAEDALKDFERVLELIGDTNLWHKSVILGNIGVQLWARGQPERAHAMLLGALEAKRLVGDRREESLSLSNAGFSFYRLGNFEEAHRYCEDALRIFRRLGYKRGELVSVHNLAEISLLQGDLEGTNEYLTYVETLLESYPHEPHLIELRNLQGELALTINDIDRAREYFLDSLTRAREQGIKTFEIGACEGLAEVCRCAGELEQAVDYIQQATKGLEDESVSVDHPLRVWTRAATILKSAGRLEQAKRHKQKARALFEAELRRFESHEARNLWGGAFPWHREIAADYDFSSKLTPSD